VSRIFTLLAVAVLALGLGARAAAAFAPLGPIIVGELTRIDLTRRSVFVKTDGREAREVEASTGTETRIVSRGRAWRLEDLRPGDRVVVAANDQGGSRRARVIKVVGRAAIPSPSTSPSAVAPSPAAPTALPGAGSPG
jgi:hypothetical protein